MCPYFNYEDCRNTISRFAGSVLPLFADGWSRFPDEQMAARITPVLESQIKFWEEHSQENADSIKKTITAIKHHI